MSSGGPQPSWLPEAPLDDQPAVAPGASAYVLNSSFSITDTPVTRSYDWALAARTGTPDGYNRTLLTINGQMPGPLVEANEGDTLIFNITNNLSNETTSIHWHGMYQNGTAFMDGVPGVSACPIQPGQSFVYNFTLTQYGTYWYHSHSSVQYTDGILGPLIIHSTEDPLVLGTDFDEEQVLLYQDWYHEQAANIVTELLSVDGYDGTAAAPSPQSGLLNGEGMFNCSAIADTDSTECTDTSYPEITVTANAKTRFRLINGGSHAQFWFSVDNHTLSVVEADGTVVSGADSIHRVPFHNGQRYSVIIDTTVGSEGDSFYVRGVMNTNCFAVVDDNLNATTFAVMRYGSNSTGLPADSVDWTDTLTTDCIDLDDDVLVPVVSKDAPSTVDQRAAFDSEFGTVVYSDVTYNRFLVNDTSYTNYIYQPLLEAVAAGTDINSTDVSNVVFDDDVWSGDIIINNLDAALDHPYHLHGNEFFIVARGSGSLSLDDADGITYNTSNPVRRDTLVIPADSYAVLRFANDNPGVWVMHCHIAWHLAEGFLGVVVSRPNAIAALDFPDSIQESCDARPSFISALTTEPGRKRNQIGSPAQLGRKEARADGFDARRLARSAHHWGRKRFGRSSI
ncbi:uncharacterized protein STEHIDRAFT_152988 [Stereum hirsutum FP-91666 SS1]|uniref:uncharacterized protein n=1 Tax=Stereum hirsutum (strain FP-91666) TaxID=721885 RepID=UPI000440B440|nr:uncharacterized protein STEHIDRAFT_152988 [Stereum hirsutum FP-91666 SS1]EIM91340.1 hypothetical protein STEHIDRAFT_152988 [Stereum hirsutum FP-91666 SS1]